MSSVFAGACFEERRGYLDTFRRCFFVDFLLTEWPCHQTLSFTTGIAQQFEISTAIPIHQTVCSSMYRMSHSAPALFQIRPSLDVYPFTLPQNHFLPPPEPRMPSSPFSRSTPQPANHLCGPATHLYDGCSLGISIPRGSTSRPNSLLSST